MNRQHARLVAHLETSGIELLAFVAELPDSELHRTPAAGEWSIHAIVAHLRDVEQQVFLKRIQRILSEPGTPRVEDFDQEQWNREHYRPEEPLPEIIKAWRAARRKELNLLRGVPDRDWARTAIHPEYGKISIEWLAVHNYAHTLDHLHQLLKLQEKSLLGRLNAG